MGKKYIIELEETPFIQHFKNGAWETIYRVKGFNSLVFDWNGLQMLTPYTEPDLEQVRKEAYDKCMDEAEMLAYKLYSPKIDEAYQRGLADAWEAAMKISMSKIDGGLSWEEMNDIFGTARPGKIYKTFTASECIEKIRAYEQENEEIKVGDEVVGTYTDEEETEPFVIIRKVPEIYPTHYFGIYSKSGGFCQGGLKLKKTGRHFPEIAEVLQKMKETDNG